MKFSPCISVLCKKQVLSIWIPLFILILLTQQIKQFTFKKGLEYLNTAVTYPALNTQGEEGVTYHDSHTTSIHPLV